MRRKYWGKSLLPMVLAAAMTMSGAAGAAEAEQSSAREELLESLVSLKIGEGSSLLERDLALDEFGKAIQEKGLKMDAEFSLPKSTVYWLGMDETPLEDGTLAVQASVDPDQKKWQLDAAAQIGDEVILDGSIYGDSGLLSVSVPKLYSEEAAITAGKLGEQLDDSALFWYSGMNYMLGNRQIPDLEVRFYPEEEDMDRCRNLLFPKELTDYLSVLIDQVTVEKAELEDLTVYTVTAAAEDLVNLQESVVDSYLSMMWKEGILSAYEMERLSDECQRAVKQLLPYLEDEFVIDFYTKNGRVQKISFETIIGNQELYQRTMAVQREAAEEAETEDWTEAETEDWTEAETEEWTGEETEEWTGEETEDWYEPETMGQSGSSRINFVTGEIVFENPADPYQNFEVSIQVAHTPGKEFLNVGIKKTTETSARRERTEISAEVSEYNYEVYSGTPLRIEYDSDTGNLDVIIKLGNVYSMAVLSLDSTIEKEKGGYISWKIDELMLADGYDELGIKGTLRLEAEQPEVTGPKHPKMLLEMNEGALYGMAAEISYNIDRLGDQLDEIFY